MIRDILQQYRDESAFNRDLGDRFERLMRAYLKLDPQYLALFVTVQTRPLLSQARLSESFFIGGRLLGLGGSGVLYR